MRGWPTSQRVIRQTVNVPDPLTTSMVAALDAGVARGMVGRAGVIRSGISTAIGYKFNGYLHPAVGIPTQASSPSVMHGPATLLPATSGPVVPAGRSVADVIGANS